MHLFASQYQPGHVKLNGNMHNNVTVTGIVTGTINTQTEIDM